VRAGRIGQPLQLFEVLVDMECVVGTLAWCTDEKGPFDERLDFDQLTDATSE
jgi:hypothetical protein